MAEPSSLERLKQLCAKPLEHPSVEELRRSSQSVVDLVLADWEVLPTQPIGRRASPQEMETLLGESMPADELAVEQILARFRDDVLPYSLRPTHPRFLAFVPSGASFPSILGDWLIGGINFFGSVWKEGAGPAQVELVVLDWFRQLLGFPKETKGILTGGGSEALLTALVAARELVPRRIRDRAVLYTSEQRHWSVDRAVRIAGLSPGQLRPLPTDAGLRLSAEVLRQAVAEDVRGLRVPWMVIATAGTTNTGAIDPLDDIAEVCREHRLWLHADAAYGWVAALSDEGRKLLRGIERADSVSLDPHKWFGQTYEVGCLLVRDGAALVKAFSVQPEYMQDVNADPGEVNFCDHGIALTRRCRALKIWFSVKALGVDWFRRLYEHGCNLAELTERLLRETGEFEVLGRPQLSVVCFRYVPAGGREGGPDLDALQRAIAAEALKTGRVFLTTTRVSGIDVLRVCFVNWRTTTADVEEVVTLLGDIGKRLSV